MSTRWSANEHILSRTGHTDYFVIEVLLEGTFEKRTDEGVGTADANVAMLFGPRECFEIDHSCGESNAGITIRIEPSVIARWLPPTRVHRDSLSVASGWMSRMVSPSAALGVQSLATYLSSQHLNRPDSKLVEQWLGRCLSQLMAASNDMATKCRSRRVEKARQYLNVNFASPVRRSEVAQAVDWSPWLLSREFTRQVGVTMHAYLIRLRLRAALRAVARGCDDLTTLGLQVGFSSHSHFSAAFKGAFGVSPRELRKRFKNLAHANRV